MSSFEFLHERLGASAKRDRRRQLVTRTADGIHLVEADGRRLINFGSNDYLGLAAEAESVSAAKGSAASPLVCGWTREHQQLADQLAQFESTEAALLFPTGFAACSGTLATLASADDLILSDQLNHASLIDGCRWSRATRMIFPHRDYVAVDGMLRKHRSEFDRVWIVTDTVFSMDGDLAPLGQLADAAERHDADLIVDEAHGTGVLGTRGSGLCEALGLKDRVPIRIGTLSKAVGSQGGFVAAPHVVIDYLTNRCRPLIFSTALAPVCVAAASDALKRLAGEPERRDHLHRLSRRLRQQLAIACEPLESAIPIVPLVIGDDSAAVDLSERLAEAGFFVPAIRPPTVPEGTARLRISLSAAHDEGMVDALVIAIRKAIGE